MALKLVYDSQDEIDEKYRDLYTERDGKFHLTGIEGMKTQKDLDALSEALRKERNDHKETKTALDKFNGLDPDEVHAKLDRIPELEAAAGDKLDEAKIDELVEARIRTKIAPVERERDTALRERDAAVTERDEAKAEIRTGKIRQAVTEAAVAAKVVDTALEDVTMVAERIFEVNDQGAITARDNVGVTPGIDPKTWITEMGEKRPHWFPPSEGGGGGGGQGGTGITDNPWTDAHWNMTRQGQIHRENPERAAQLAKLAGTTIGGARPAPKAA